MRVRLTQIDGKLPSLALMKLAHYHRARGDEVYFSKHIERRRGEPADYDLVYGSAIFSFSAARVAQFHNHFPGAIVGGTHNLADNVTVEEVLGVDQYEHYDYSIYGASFAASIGFTQRGCRLKCKFCCVPMREGKPRSVNSIGQIWRGDPWPRHLHLLDNDFFGQPHEQWQARIAEIRAGDFKVCLNQGVNIRMIDDEAAAALASIPLYDDSFTQRRLYTAWDNLGDEERFFRGVDTLERHGIAAHHLLVYMLVGYDKRETWERVLYRFRRMTERRIKPYPMIYGARDRTLPLGNADPRLADRTLAQFQRWAIRRYYTVVDFAGYDTSVHAQRTEPHRRCKHCSRSLADHARADALFCSASCRSVSHRRHGRLAEHALRRRKCRSCRRLIPCRARSDALYCSAACRQRAYRQSPGHAKFDTVSNLPASS